MEIELICNLSLKIKFVWLAKLFLFLTLLSCSTQKNLDDFAEIDRNKGSEKVEERN